MRSAASTSSQDPMHQTTAPLPALFAAVGHPTNSDVTCKTAHFHIITTAGAYSTLLGVLAGFAFTSLITILVVHDGDDGLDFVAAAEALVVVFVGLAITSVSYAVLSGELTDQGRVVTEEILVGIAFVICALQLLTAVALTFQAAGGPLEEDNFQTERPGSHLSRHVARSLCGISAMFLCPLGIVYITVAMQDYKAVHLHGGSPVTYGEVLAAASLILGILIWTSPKRLKAVLSRSKCVRRCIRVSKSSRTFLVFVIVPLVADAFVVGRLGSCTSPSPLIMLAMLTYVFLVMLLTSINFVSEAPPKSLPRR